MKTWQIVRRILHQHRWLYLFLILWPFVMAVILLLPGGAPNPGDVFSILREECFYGLALVAFTGSAQLGSELRSRRVAAVLARAVSRREYLLALLWAAWLPLALYAASFLLSGLSLLGHRREMLRTLEAMTLALLLLGLWAAAVSVFFATWLPSWLASMATLGLISASFVLEHSARLGFGDLWGAIVGEGVQVKAGRLVSAADALIAGLAIAIFFAAAVAIFERRDLNLKSG